MLLCNGIIRLYKQKYIAIECIRKEKFHSQTTLNNEGILLHHKCKLLKHVTDFVDFCSSDGILIFFCCNYVLPGDTIAMFYSSIPTTTS